MDTVSKSQEATNQDPVLARRVIRCGIFVGRCLEVVAAWRLRGRQRAQLHALDDRTLKDIGVSRLEIDSIVNSPNRDASGRVNQAPPDPVSDARNEPAARSNLETQM
ncbi:DUF1127 domain-containing protein [Bradyrhizobium diazoefficiens]|nr:DUF1127 domain-containing protein [Bradyrhizobium diazoefficiens]MBR0777504.1 DUF1127 domain-containing protein [Bradyrhizobium diazoefficiens]